MLERSRIVEILDGIYATRVAGEQDAFARIWADGATYQMAGDAVILGATLTHPRDARQATSELINQFKFHSAVRTDAVVEGNRAAVMLNLVVSKGDGPKHETRVFNLWEFDDDGKALSLIEFADTALVTAMIAGQDGNLRPAAEISAAQA